jgi:hypothetical protein
MSPPEYKAAVLHLKVEGEPEKFPGEHIAERASFEETDKFIEAWPAAKHRREDAERT